MTQTPSPVRPTLEGPVPSATPTPLTYTVQAKDDMLSIALRYGISLEALLAANPSVNPRAMSVGTVLVIPSTGRAQPTAQNPSPTPMVLQLAAPDCWPAGDGGLWCFVLAGNPGQAGVENPQALVRVAGENNTPLLERQAYAILDVLPAGKTTALSVYFPAPVPAPFRASAELSAAFPLAEAEARYRTLELKGVQTTIAADGLSAKVSGQVSAPQGDAKTAWIAAMALDQEGKVLGVRRWEAPAPVGKEGAAFNLNVYSLGGKIAQVEVLSEGKP